MPVERIVGRPRQASPTVENRHDNTAEPSISPVDPIAELIARLDAAAARGGTVTLDGGENLRVRRVPGGFAVGPRP